MICSAPASFPENLLHTDEHNAEVIDACCRNPVCANAIRPHAMVVGRSARVIFLVQFQHCTACTGCHCAEVWYFGACGHDRKDAWPSVLIEIMLHGNNP